MVTYTLAGGCFWCLDAVFRKLNGVISSVCGYVGGDEKDADYYHVAYGKTDHAESVQVTFNDEIISKETILDIFFLIHDPTSLNQQGADKGTQYRSAMFYESDEQKSEFETAIKRAQTNWDRPIVTELTKLYRFYEAESEHQDYFVKNPMSRYCYVVIEPKVVKARKHYEKYFKEES